MPQSWQPQYQPAAQVVPYGQPRPAWQQPAPYGRAPAAAPKSTGTGLLLGLLLPGAGCMYAGRAGVGVLILALWILSIPLALVFFIGVVTGFACWVASGALGYVMTRDWNTAHGFPS